MYSGNYRITYYDLDLAGRVKLSALLRMVHIAAEVNANDLGIGFEKLSGLNMSFVLQRFALSTTRMPTYDEVVTIRTWPASLARGTFLRKGDMYDTNGHKLMEWTSLWILFDIKERKILKPSALPIELPVFEDHGVQISPEKVILTPSQGNAFSEYIHTVSYADVDTNMHMNNSIYGDLIGNALFPNMESAATSQNFHEFHINYLAEARFNEKITVTTHHEENSFIVIGKTPDRISFAAKIS
ncbi:MAG: thioesterase [Defluviitaleaceae bacterium]|nr:thioesterase [Defluviitaleaceae bacterium]